MNSNDPIKVLVVEDEIAVRRSLIAKLKREELDLQLIGEAQNAEEAYEMMKVRLPDIILLDMRMPGMGGMKFLEILSNEFSEIKVIIISGYSDFEYAKQAIKCGAVDYLLKPIIKEDFTRVLQSTVEIIKKKTLNKNLEIHQNIIFNESVPLFRTNLLNKLLKGVNLQANEIVKRLSHLNVNLDYQYYVLASIRIIDFDRAMFYYMKDNSLLYFALDNVINESVGDEKYFTGFKSEIRENEYLFIFGFNDKDEVYKKVIYRLENIVINVERFNKFKVSIKVSEIFDNLLGINSIYLQTTFNWDMGHSETQSQVTYLGDRTPESQNDLDAFTQEELNLLVNLMEANDFKGIVFLVNAKFQHLNDASSPPEHYKMVASRIYQAVAEYLKNKFFDSESSILNHIPTTIGAISNNDECEELKYRILKILSDIVDYVDKKKHTEINEVIKQAKDYIEKYYYEDLTLDMLSQKYFLNRTYFSELFTKEIGCGFKKYVNKVRIEKSKKLLVEQGMKAAMVSELVGFKDPVYFNVTFKNYTGLPPGEYKQKYTQA